MGIIHAELEARAKYKVGERVIGPGFGLFEVVARYWRRSEDAFYYDLKEAPAPGARPATKRKIPENRIQHRA